MEKWEYKTIKVDPKGSAEGVLDIGNFNMVINQLGSVGWEMVSCFTTMSAKDFTEVIAVFKRKMGVSAETRAEEPARGKRIRANEEDSRIYEDKPKSYSNKTKSYGEKSKTYGSKFKGYGDKPKAYGEKANTSGEKSPVYGKSSGYREKSSGYSGKSSGFSGKGPGRPGKGKNRQDY